MKKQVQLKDLSHANTVKSDESHFSFKSGGELIIKKLVFIRFF